MRRSLAIAALMLAACSGSDSADSSAEWQRVLNSKKTATAPNASAQEKQVYADALGAFVKSHPTHSRGREVYRGLQLAFGEDLAAMGRYQDANRFYRAVLVADPMNLRAQHDIMAALDHLAISRGKLLALEKGMSQEQGAQIPGKPIPGWTARNPRPDARMEAGHH